MGTLVNLPTLPVELQFNILIHIPPNQLFTLRRVSRSWNHMLQNPELLESINKQLPFISSAPDLTSRMKRRMRMARGEPVWVTSWPWPEAIPTIHGVKRVPEFENVGFSKGRLVALSGYCSRGCSMSDKYNEQEQEGTFILPVIKFKIRNLARPKNDSSAIEVDVVETLRRIYPDVYDAISRSFKSPGGNMRLNCLHTVLFSVRQDKVIVGVRHHRASCWRPEFPLFRDTHFFIFSIFTGDLIQSIRKIPRNEHDYFQFARVNETHFVLVYRTFPPCDAICNHTQERNSNHIQSYASAYSITTYSLNDCSNLPEILIVSPDISKRSAKIRPTVLDRLEETMVALDRLGRLWFPFLFGATVGTIKYDIGSRVMHPSRGYEYNPLGKYIYTSKKSMQDLPRSQCGDWSFIPVVSGLQPFIDFISVPTPWPESIIEEETQPAPSPYRHGDREVIIFAREDGICTVKLIPHESELENDSYSADLKERFKQLTHPIEIQFFRGINYKNVNSVTHTLPFCHPIWDIATALPYGYIFEGEYRWVSPEAGGEIANIYLLELHCNQRQHEAQRRHVIEHIGLHDEVGTVSHLPGCKAVKNGLRVEHMLVSCAREIEEKDQAFCEIFYVCGDDGLIVYVGLREDPKDEDYWLVCYEENWVV